MKMDQYPRELLLEIIESWTESQLNTYIAAQENRLEDTRSWIKELKEVRRKRQSKNKKTLDNGVRGGI